MTDEVTYTPEELQRAQQIVADNDAKQRAALAAKRAAYGKAAQELTGMPEWSAVRGKIADMTSTLEDDGQFAIHVTALSSVMQRLTEAVATLPPVSSPATAQ